jgi:hypothetical protein
MKNTDPQTETIDLYLYKMMMNLHHKLKSILTHFENLCTKFKLQVFCTGFRLRGAPGCEKDDSVVRILSIVEKTVNRYLDFHFKLHGKIS